MSNAKKDEADLEIRRSEAIPPRTGRRTGRWVEKSKEIVTACRRTPGQPFEVGPVDGATSGSLRGSVRKRDPAVEASYRSVAPENGSPRHMLFFIYRGPSKPAAAPPKKK